MLKRPTQTSAANYDWAISSAYELEAWDSTYQIQQVFTIADLPPHYLKRFPLVNRFLFTRIPFLRHSYHIAQIRLGLSQG